MNTSSMNSHENGKLYIRKITWLKSGNLSWHVTIIVFYCGGTVIGDFYCTKKISPFSINDYNLNLANIVYNCTLQYNTVQYVIRKVVIVILIIILYVAVITYKR